MSAFSTSRLKKTSGTQSNVTTYVRIFKLPLSKFSLTVHEESNEKHLIIWAAIYTIVTYKFPKVFKDHEQYLRSASSINQNRR